MKGLYGKYNVTKANGKPVAAEAQYFVLRVDTDVHARRAMRAYARSIEKHGGDTKLVRDIWRWLYDMRNTPAAIEEVDQAAKHAGLTASDEV